MIAILLGLFAALCWSLHDMLARLYASRLGSYRLAFLALTIGAVLLLLPVGWRGTILRGDLASLELALAMGVAYAVAIGGLFKAFSLAPVSIVGPLTSSYPALVLLWGVVNGLSPSLLEWSAVALILAGSVIVSACGPRDGGFRLIAPNKRVVVMLACAATQFGFAASLLLGQKAALSLGEFETTFVSRLPAALLVLPLALKDQGSLAQLTRQSMIAVLAMATMDVLAVSAINYAGRFDNREFAAMGISTYGAGSVLLARLFLKESVSAGQWAGIALLTAGVAYLGYAGV
jgi:drug/metabolite transporter (DMT)-like permease